MISIERLEPRDWQDMSTAPRDGRYVLLTWMEDGEPQEIFPMHWEPAAKNELFAPGIRGMWVALGGSMTWSEGDPEASPTHWADDPDLAKHSPPGPRLVWSRA